MRLRSICCTVLSAMALLAQRGGPPGMVRQMERPAEHWLDPVTEAERKREMPKAGLTRASVHRALPERMLRQGQWSRTPEGKFLFRAALRSPNARGLRLHFSNFDAGAGRVWLYPADNPETGYFDGPFTGKGPYGDGEFWSGFVEGEGLILEFESTSETLPFRLDLASHVFADIVPVKPGGETASRATSLGPLPRAALGCHKDVQCFPEWQERSQSVGRYLFETASGGALCSGAAVKTRNDSGIPYFLTADHCVSNPAEARSVQVFWGYTSSACAGPPKNLRQLPTTLGSTYLAGGGTEQGDFTLLRLNGQLPQGVTFSGWTPDEIGTGTRVTGIHHPGGDYQRISFGERGDDIPSRGRPVRNYYTIVWREGITEGGSSGSPIFNDEGLIVGMLSAGPKPPPGKTECDFAPAFDFYGRFSTAYPTLQAFLEERTTGGGTPPPPPPTGGNTLTNNTPANFRVGPFEGPVLLGESGTFKVEVPQGATRLEIRLRTATPNADLDLFVRHGEAPDIDGGKVTADHSSEGLDGNETIVITAQSNPPLRPGTYFATIAVFTPNVTAEGTVTAIVTGGGGGGGTGGGQALTSGQTRTVNIDPVANAVLLGGTLAHTIEVPQGATRLEIRLQTDNRNVDLDLFARFGQQVTLANSRAVADHSSEGPDGNENIVITPTSTPTLRAGTYFIHIGVFTTNTAITTRLTATVTTGAAPPGSGTVGGPLTSGAPANFSIGPVTGAQLFSGANAYQIQVPAGSTRLEVRVRTATPGADVDLYVRANEAPTVSGGRVVADHVSESDSGEETIVITPQSNPPLRTGTYHIALGLFTPNVRVTGIVLASVGSTTSSNTVAQPLLPGALQAFRLAAVNGPSLVLDPSFRIAVPQGATRLRVQVRTRTPNVDVDLFARFNQAPAVVNGSIAADHRSTGDTGEESLDINPQSNPPLRAGTYFFSLGLFTSGVAAEGEIVVFVDSAPPAPQSAVTLNSGVPAPFTLPAAANAALYAGNFGFRVQVPAGATSLSVRLNTATPNADVDLYIRRGADVVLNGEDVVADYYSEGATGNEILTITRTSEPPLEQGTYFVALGNFARNVQVSGTVTATVERGATAPPTTTTRTLSLNNPVNWSIDAVPGPTLFSGSNAFRLDVTNVSKMEVVLTTEQEGADVDVYVRYGTPPVLQNGNVVADFRATTPSGNERITIQPGPNSPLRTGTYYIALAVYSPDIATSGTLAVVDQSIPLGTGEKRGRMRKSSSFEKSSRPSDPAGPDGELRLKEKRPWLE